MFAPSPTPIITPHPLTQHSRGVQPTPKGGARRILPSGGVAHAQASRHEVPVRHLHQVYPALR